MRCRDCGKTPVLKPDSKHIYNGHDYGPVWECECGNRVGCHKGTTTPLGSVCNEPTRIARQKVHQIFDPLWKKGLLPSRKDAYKWLARKMDMPNRKCHISMFNLDECVLAMHILRHQFPEDTLVDNAKFQELIS
jgi:hypothetical protein